VQCTVNVSVNQWPIQYQKHFSWPVLLLDIHALIQLIKYVCRFPDLKRASHHASPKPVQISSGWCWGPTGEIGSFKRFAGSSNNVVGSS